MGVLFPPMGLERMPDRPDALHAFSSRAAPPYVRNPNPNNNLPAAGGGSGGGGQGGQGGGGQGGGSYPSSGYGTQFQARGGYNQPGMVCTGAGAAGEGLLRADAADGASGQGRALLQAKPVVSLPSARTVVLRGVVRGVSKGSIRMAVHRRRSPPPPP